MKSINSVSRLISRCILCFLSQCLGLFLLQNITQRSSLFLSFSSFSTFTPLNQPSLSLPTQTSRLDFDPVPCPVVRIQCLPPEESLLSIAMPLVRAFFVNESTLGPFFGSCCLFVSLETRTAASASVRVLSSAEGCDVSVILGDCDWLIVP